MTENEAIEIVRMMPTTIFNNDEDTAKRMAIQALEEIQQYREIEAELREKYHANVDIKMLMQHFIETIFKGEKHEGFCILTNEDAEMWDAYREIGTVEECRTAVERMKTRKIKGRSLTHEGYVGNCPCCGKLVALHDDNKICRKCGQALDWSE